MTIVEMVFVGIVNKEIVGLIYPLGNFYRQGIGTEIVLSP